MRISVRSSSGSVVVVMLIVVVLIGVTLGSYLHLVSHQNLSVMRSMAWNHAVSVAEAGIEEAMAHLNYNTTNRVRDGWGVSGTNVVKEKTIGVNKYKTYVQNTNLHPTNDRPVIVSEGWVINPKTGQFLPRPRVVRVSTTNDALFAKGMVAKGQIDLGGNNIRTDSYDSTINAYNTGGRYDPTKFKDGGDVATNGKLINVGNAEIYGRASTGPGGIVDLGAQGTVGSTAWHANPANSGKMQPGWSSDDMNVQFPDVRDPYAQPGVFPPTLLPNPLVAPSGIIDGEQYAMIINTPGNYKIGEISGADKRIYIGADVNLVVGDLNMTGGNAGIMIATNASLNLYVTGASATIGGQGVMNKTGSAMKFNYWGLPSNKTLNLQGNGEFAGTVYAPQAQLNLGGGGSNLTDFMGASVTGSVKLNGHFKFHYDESLGVYGPRRGYTINTWLEAAWDETTPLL
jgi:hypothetical protein